MDEEEPLPEHTPPSGVDDLTVEAVGLVTEALERDLVGRNVLPGRWTFQVVEAYDDTYWSPFRDLERSVRDRLVQGRRHLFEAQMKEDRRTHGRPHHEARPAQSPE